MLMIHWPRLALSNNKTPFITSFFQIPVICEKCSIEIKDNTSPPVAPDSDQTNNETQETVAKEEGAVAKEDTVAKEEGPAAKEKEEDVTKEESTIAKEEGAVAKEESAEP